MLLSLPVDEDRDRLWLRFFSFGAFSFLPLEDRDLFLSSFLSLFPSFFDGLLLLPLDEERLLLWLRFFSFVSCLSSLSFFLCFSFVSLSSFFAFLFFLSLWSDDQDRGGLEELRCLRLRPRRRPASAESASDAVAALAAPADADEAVLCRRFFSLPARA